MTHADSLATFLGLVETYRNDDAFGVDECVTFLVAHCNVTEEVQHLLDTSTDPMIVAVSRRVAEVLDDAMSLGLTADDLPDYGTQAWED